MEQSRLQSRVAVLCAIVLLHVTVVTALLQRRLLGSDVLPHPNTHSTEVVRLPVATIVNLESPFGRDGLHPRAINDAIANVTLQSVSVALPDTVPVSVPSESTADSVREQTLVGSVEIRCEVHIHQSPHGQVQAIDFGACSGDAEWQRSLMQSIERAADLVQPSAEVSFPPVRTLTVSTNSLSPALLAQQLSTAPDTNTTADR